MTLEQATLYFGLVLQLAGIGAAAWGLSDLRRKFSDQPSVLARLNARVRRAAARSRSMIRRLLRRKREVHVTGFSVAAGASASAHATVQLGAADSEAPLADRVTALEEQLRRVEGRVQDQIEAARRAADQVAREERARLNTIESDLREQIRELATGGLRLESLGLGGILVGTVLATVPAGAAHIARTLLPI